MRKANFAFVGMIFAFVMVLAVASAATSNGVSVSVDVTTLDDVSAGETYDFVVTVENNNGTDLYFDFGTSGWSWNVTDRQLIADGSSATYLATLTVPSSGNKNVIVNAYENDTSDELFDVSQLITLNYVASASTNDKNVCSVEFSGEQGDLELRNVDVKVTGKGDDEEWQYLDSVEIEVEVENNNGDDNIDDVEVRVYIYDGKIENGGNDVTNDFDFDDDVLDDIGKLKDDDKETVVFTIDELSTDVEDGTYYLYIMAYSAGDEDLQCVSEAKDFDDDYYYEFSVESVDDDEAVVAQFDDVSMNVYCGQDDVEISFPVYNLGEDDQDEVLVNVYNSELGIDEYVVIDDLNDGDKETVSLYVNIPENLDKDKYDLSVKVYFDWDDDEDEEEITSYDENTNGEAIRLNVLGCSIAAPSISANLESNAAVGEDLVISVSVTNNGADSNFVVSAEGYDSWANVVEIVPQTLSIDEDSTKTATIKLAPTVGGYQTFDVVVIVDGESYERSVSVNVAEDENGSMFNMDKTTLILSGAIILLVILIVIVIAVRASRRRA